MIFLQLRRKEAEFVGYYMARSLPEMEIKKILKLMPKTLGKPQKNELENLFQDVCSVQGLSPGEVLANRKKEHNTCKEAFVLIASLKYTPGILQVRRSGIGIRFAKEIGEILQITQCSVSRMLTRALHDWRNIPSYRGEITTIAENIKKLR